MPVPDEENGLPAGISRDEEVDVAALFARLQEEVRRGAAPELVGSGEAAFRLAARAQAERLWPVSTDRPLLGRPGLRGAVARPVKQVLRKLMRWYVEPVASDQRAFNDAVLKLLDDLAERVDRLERRGR